MFSVLLFLNKIANFSCKLKILNIDKRHLSKKTNKQRDQHVKQETLVTWKFSSVLGKDIDQNLCHIENVIKNDSYHIKC